MIDPAPQIRAARPADTDALVTIWHAGWHDAHASLVPADILTFRKPAHFAQWLAHMPEPPFVAETDQIIGFVACDGAELGKLYVTQAARGTGIAQTLMQFGERLIAAKGHARAVVHCTAGNDRAQRFYERAGWVFSEVFDDHLWHPDPACATPPIKTLRYTKPVT